MSWIGDRVRDESRARTYGDLADLVEWSPWLAFEVAVAETPRLPGVYLLRDPADQVIRYAGRAGDRAGGGRPQGLHGRLAAYRSGHEAVSGFAEAALDLALGDADWVDEQLGRLRAGRPHRAKQWAADAVARFAPEVSWTTCGEAAEARLVESEVVELLRPVGLWNR